MRILIVIGLVGCGLLPQTETKPSLPTAGFVNSKGLLTSYPDLKIIGGSDATPNELPWQVSIQVQPIFGDKYHNCGGTLIDSTHIVTAGHCVANQDISRISIVAGAHNIKISEESQQVRQPKRLIWHDNFDGYTLTHDVGVITVSVPFTLNQFVQPLKFAGEGVEHTGKCVNSGWGNSNPTGGTPAVVPDALQKVDLEIYTRANCSDAYDGITVVDETMVCARGLESFINVGSCNGDSGGPLVCKDSTGADYLAGIVSWGMNPCGQYDYPTVFGDVASKAVRDFIVAEGNRP